jgi:DinB superfamily
MKILILAACTVIAASTPALAQTSPLASSAKQVLGFAKNNIVKSAEQVSEADYAFKPVDTVRSFGAIIGHIANANFMICSMGSGAANPMKDVDIEKTKTTKADLQKALADSFQGKQPRLNVLQFNIAHDMEHYGNLVTYMRIKGMVPPSSQGGM